MKVTFKKVLYEDFDIDFQKIYDFISKTKDCDDMEIIYEEFKNNVKFYLSLTHDLNSLFDSYDLFFMDSDFNDNSVVLRYIIDMFYVFLRDKFNI